MVLPSTTSETEYVWFKTNKLASLLAWKENRALPQVVAVSPRCLRAWTRPFCLKLTQPKSPKFSEPALKPNETYLVSGVLAISDH